MILVFNEKLTLDNICLYCATSSNNGFIVKYQIPLPIIQYLLQTLSAKLIIKTMVFGIIYDISLKSL